MFGVDFLAIWGADVPSASEIDSGRAGKPARRTCLLTNTPNKPTNCRRQMATKITKTHENQTGGEIVAPIFFFVSFRDFCGSLCAD